MSRIDRAVTHLIWLDNAMKKPLIGTALQTILLPDGEPLIILASVVGCVDRLAKENGSTANAVILDIYQNNMDELNELSDSLFSALRNIQSANDSDAIKGSFGAIKTQAQSVINTLFTTLEENATYSSCVSHLLIGGRGKSLTEKVRYNSRIYVVRTDKNTKHRYIMCNGGNKLLSTIRGKYRYERATQLRKLPKNWLLALD